MGAGDVAASHVNHQAPPTGNEAKDVHKTQLLQHHTHCLHQWIKRRDSESIQAEVDAARWAWLGPTLLVRACVGGEHAGDARLSLGQRRKLSIELAGKRATLAETGAWIELLRTYVREMLACEVYVRGDGTHTLLQSTTLEADTMLASDKMDSSDIQYCRPAWRTAEHANRR